MDYCGTWDPSTATVHLQVITTWAPIRASQHHVRGVIEKVGFIWRYSGTYVGA